MNNAICRTGCRSRDEDKRRLDEQSSAARTQLNGNVGPLGPWTEIVFLVPTQTYDTIRYDTI